MSYSIRITESRNRELLIELSHILKSIRNGQNYKWVVHSLDVNIVEATENHQQMTDGEYEELNIINDSNDKIPVTWDKLCRLSQLNIQLLNGEIFGVQGDNWISISIFDGDYWIVTTSDYNMMTEIELGLSLKRKPDI
jgi:hypothetical protein